MKKAKEEALEEELDETEEELEEEIEENSEDEVLEDEYELEDILAEEDLKSNSSRLHNFLMSQNNQASLNQREVSPIFNLEEDLPEVIKKDESSGRETIIEYLPNKEENDHTYQPSRSGSAPTYIQNKDFSRIYSPEDKLEQDQKQLYSSMSNISSEMAFVQKQMKPNYAKPEKLKEEDFGKEHKKSVENVVDKMRENYK